MTAVPAIARASPADAGAIAQFQITAWRQTYRGLVPDAFLDGMDAASSAERWAQRLATGARDAAIALAGGRMVAVASTHRSLTARHLPELELCTLYLAPEVHGTGLADRMMDATIGHDAAHLLVFDVNERAQRFYRRHGFAPVGGTLRDPGTGLAEQRWVRARRDA